MKCSLNLYFDKFRLLKGCLIYIILLLLSEKIMIFNVLCFMLGERGGGGHNHFVKVEIRNYLFNYLNNFI